MKSAIRLLSPVLLLVVALFQGCTTEDPSPSPSDPRSAFVGTWSVDEQGNKLTYEVTISLDPSSSSQVVISNFANAGPSSNPARAEVSGNNIFLNADQVIGDGWTINGGGLMNSSTKITWAYTLDDGATLHNLTAVYTKK